MGSSYASPDSPPFGGRYPGGGYLPNEPTDFSFFAMSWGFKDTLTGIPFGVPMCGATPSPGGGDDCGDSGSDHVTSEYSRLINMNTYPVMILSRSGKKYLISPREVLNIPPSDAPSRLPKGVFALPDEDS